MSVTTHPPEVRVDVEPDATEARLVVPAEYDRGTLNTEQCVELLRAAGVELTEAVRDAVHDAVRQAQQAERATDEDGPMEVVVASAQPPIHGRDGWVEWYVDQRDDDADTDDPEADISHYDRSGFILVEKDEVIGKVHAPTNGQNGRTVTGETIDASHGKAATLQLDSSIQQSPAGQLTAQTHGVLVRKGTQAAIHKVLNVSEDVDFSTGNIDVHGMIEAAYIEAKGDLNAHGGFAGRERGNAHIGGNLHARYLDNIHGTIHGDLIAEREIINCDLTIHGNLTAGRGAIIGGRNIVTGRIDVGVLGARAGTPTELVVGRVPRLEPFAASLTKRIKQIDARLSRLEKQLQQVSQVAGADRRSVTTSMQRHRRQLEAELDTLRQTRRKAESALKRVRQAIDEQRSVEIQVEKRIAPGVIFTVGHQRYRLVDELRGPVHIRRNRTGQIVYQREGGEPTSLSTIGETEA